MRLSPGKPPVCMRHDLASLAPLDIPDGHVLRGERPGDDAHWARIMLAAFGGGDWTPERYRAEILDHPAYRPERVLFIIAPDGTPCATASAFRDDRFGADAGYVHHVGRDPGHGGRRLGYFVTLAVLHMFRDDGCPAAFLETQDPLLPALHTYFRLGFEPLVVHENHPERWDRIHDALDRPRPDAYRRGPPFDDDGRLAG